MSTIQCTKAQADYANMTGNGIKLFQNSDLNCTIEVIERNGELGSLPKKYVKLSVTRIFRKLY